MDKQLLPSDTHDIFINMVLSVIAPNIVPILGVLAISSGVYFIIKWLNLAIFSSFLDPEPGNDLSAYSDWYDRKLKRERRGF